jgi:hypothetical protein
MHIKPQNGRLIALLVSLVLLVVSISFGQFILNVNSISFAKSEHVKTNWKIQQMFNTTATNVRIQRVIGDYVLFLGTSDNKLGLIKMDMEHNFANWNMLSIMPTGKTPYAMKVYQNRFVLIGCRGENRVDIFEFAPTESDPLRFVQFVDLGNGYGPANFEVSERTGLMYTPNGVSNTVSIVDLKPLAHDLPAQLLITIPFPDNSNPCRTTLLAPDVLMVLNAGSASVAIVDLSDILNPIILKYIDTGRSPYMGAGNGKVYVIDSQDDDFITLLDISDVHDVHLLEPVWKIFVGDGPLVPKFINNETMLLSTQGIKPATNPDVFGYLMAFDFTDYHNPQPISGVLTRRGCGGIEQVLPTPDNPNADIVVTLNTPDSTLSWVDISNLGDMRVIETSYVPNNGQIHYWVFLPDGKHAIATDKVNGQLILYVNEN